MLTTIRKWICQFIKGDLKRVLGIFKRKLGVNSWIPGGSAWINESANNSFIAVTSTEYSIVCHHISYRLPAMMVTTAESRSAEVLMRKKRLADSSFVQRSAARTSVYRSYIPTNDIASSRFVPKIISKGRSIMYCVLVVNPNSAQQCLARPAKMTVMFSSFLS